MKIFNRKLKEIKILEYKAYQGNICKVQSHNLHKGKWKKNPKFEFHMLLIEQHPSRFKWNKITTREIKNEEI